MKTSNDNAADQFVLQAIQEWGQSEKDRITAVQTLLDAAGFDAKATCWPVFGGIWPKQCEGKDGLEATAWLKTVTDTMTRGKYEGEVEHVVRMLQARQARS